LSTATSGITSLSTGLSTTNSNVDSLVDLDFDGLEHGDQRHRELVHRAEHDEQQREQLVDST
jgi:hypothetical protein